jgi:hypothetical protein
MAADFTLPTVSGQYTDIPGQIRDNVNAAVTAHESDASTNKPTGAKQITSTGVVKRWNGSSWVELHDAASHIAATGTAVHGLGSAATKTAGTATGQVPLAGGTLTGTGSRLAILNAAGAIIEYAPANASIVTDANGNVTTSAITIPTGSVFLGGDFLGG